MAGHWVFDAPSPIIVRNRDNRANPAPNRDTLVNLSRIFKISKIFRIRALTHQHRFGRPRGIRCIRTKKNLANLATLVNPARIDTMRGLVRGEAFGNAEHSWKPRTDEVAHVKSAPKK